MNRRPGRYCFLVTVFMSFHVAAAPSGTYYSDDDFDVVGAGAPGQRNCAVVLHPSQRLGTTAWPQLRLTTTGDESVGMDLQDASRFTDVTVVQGNLRRPFAPLSDVSLDTFRESDVVQAILSKRPFFITARMAASRQHSYVSSRYDPIDFDHILEIVGAHCRFDAEALLSDLSSRQKAERDLDLPPSRLTIIRWVLRKKYGGDDQRPDDSQSLSTAERGYLKRYAAEIGLPVSRYLNQAVLQKLLLDATALDLKTFTRFEKRDLGGGDYDVVRGTSLELCDQRCQSEDACRAYTFDRWNRMCFLKTASTGALRLEPRSVTGVISTTGLTDYVGEAVIEKRRRKAFPDVPYIQVWGETYEQCAAMCLDDVRCGGFNFESASGRCGFIDWPNEYTDRASTDLGFKIQPPP